VAVAALLATELSGFGLASDISDAIVIAISQSGTTTDTNRTVDVVRARGAAVISIVNRRGSDLTDKSGGVLYTSDGRDVEMSVASTKAFYAQVAAGFLLADVIARELGAPDTADRQTLLRALRDLPDAMDEVLTTQPHIAAVAQRQALTRRSWAIVGNGVNFIAAHELRIKLSELCYKSIACDVTEDKKHIDLSAEPMILVCAAGLVGSTADDVVKEIGIFRAHKAAPIAIATRDDDRFSAALEHIPVPPTHPTAAFVLAAMAGHLFGYEAALAIDATARPLREARAAIEVAARTDADPDVALTELADTLAIPTAHFFDGLRASHYDGALEAATAVRLAGVLRYATGLAPLDLYQTEFGKVGTPSTVIEDLTLALTKAIDELTRPIDAIKHQAKTVTVGISRSDESLLHVPLVAEVLATGVARDTLSYRTLRTLVALDPAVARVTGFTRYRVEGDVGADAATIHVIDRGGIGTSIASRTDADSVLRGTKHRVAYEREVTVAIGRRDQRTVVIVPEVKGNETVGLALLHVVFHDRLTASAMRSVLQGYRGRYAALKDAVTETEPTFDDTRLDQMTPIDLLSQPVYVLAERWRS
jgi:glucosamine--fructose-6-phosphate aminotransferase (isomerizing)